LFIVKNKSNKLIRINNSSKVNNEVIHKLPSVVEWQDSNFSFNKNINFDINAKNKLVYTLLDSYFNSIPNNLYKDKIKRKWMSLKRIFISKPTIKHNNNEVIITVYSFNKQKLFFLNKIKKINKLFLTRSSLKKYKFKFDDKFRIWGFIYKLLDNGIINNIFVKLNVKNINIFLYNILLKFSNYNINKNIVVKKIANKIFLEKFRKNYIYKYYTSMLYINNLKFSMTNLLGLSNILNKIYNKKVIINIISLKYLFLDNSIMVNAVVRKLNDRKKRILKVMRRGLKLAKKARLHPTLLIPKIKLKDTISNELQNYKDIMNNDNHNFVFNNLSNKYLTGIRLQGNGRLTKRLTASRSMLKYSHKGSLKNVHSSFQKVSAVMLKGYSKSNIQYLNINSKNRNGSFGVKGWSSSF
jgi:hypothetical protein